MTITMTLRSAGTLPRQITGFVGRTVEVDRLTSLVDASRLVTVLGPGGVGKTRLALRVAEGIAGRFEHGVRLVELSGLREPELLPHTVAVSVGPSEREAQDQPLDVLLEYVRDRRLLLVLDTCEHLVDACAMLTDLLLAETDGVTVLATSRQPLDVPGEHTFIAPPLPISEDGGAVELFAQRAAAVVPGFAITDANRDDVVRLCRRLDGIPLAIELATVRLRAVPLDQLVQRVDQRFRLLTGGRRTAVPRHQTLRTAIDWSHELCTPAEQVLWRRLSVLAGSFDVATIEEICAGGDLPGPIVLETLIGLVDKSVVLRIDGETTRYRLLDTVREYGADRLAEAGEDAEFRHRHLAHYSAAAEQFDRNFVADDQIERFHALADHHDNLRVALEHALTLPDPERVVRLATDLWGYWSMSGRCAEGRYWLTKALDRVTGEPRCLAVRGYLAVVQGETDTALDDLDRVEETGDAVLDSRVQAFRYFALVLAARHEEAGRVESVALELSRTAGDDVGTAMVAGQAGLLRFTSGDLEGAVTWAKEAMRLLGEGSREHWIRGFLYTLLSAARFSLGDREAATEAIRIAVRLKYAAGDELGLAYALEVCALIASAEERYERSAWLGGAAAPLWERGGRRWNGNAVMEALHVETMRATARAIGEERFQALRDEGSARPIDQIVSLALDDADELPPPAEPAISRDAQDVLTAREREVAELVAKGLTNRDIAEKLVISTRTVDAHVEHILAKLGLSSRVMVAIMLTRERPADP